MYYANDLVNAEDLMRIMMIYSFLTPTTSLIGFGCYKTRHMQQYNITSFLILLRVSLVWFDIITNKLLWRGLPIILQLTEISNVARVTTVATLFYAFHFILFNFSNSSKEIVFVISLIIYTTKTFLNNLNL